MKPISYLENKATASRSRSAAGLIVALAFFAVFVLSTASVKAQGPPPRKVVHTGQPKTTTSPPDPAAEPSPSSVEAQCGPWDVSGKWTLNGSTCVLRA
jgi:hypothetical protein